MQEQGVSSDYSKICNWSPYFSVPKSTVLKLVG